MRAVFQRTYDGKTYTMTDDDLFILAVAMYGEKRSTPSELEASALAWCWMNRYLLHRNPEKWWSSLADLIMAHSQPVNPRWRRDGSKCKDKPHTGDCSESRLAWRDKMASIIERHAYEEIPSGIREYAERMAAGELPQLADPTNVDFGSNVVAQNYGTQLMSGGEWYMNVMQCKRAGIALDWVPGTVYVANVTPEKEEEEEEKGAIPTVGILIGGAWLAMLGWAIYRLLRQS